MENSPLLEVSRQDITSTVLTLIMNYIAAACEESIVYILSTMATSSIEEVAEVAPNGNNWFQLYIYKDRYSSIINARAS